MSKGILPHVEKWTQGPRFPTACRFPLPDRRKAAAVQPPPYRRRRTETGILALGTLTYALTLTGLRGAGLGAVRQVYERFAANHCLLAFILPPSRLVTAYKRSI